MSGDKKQVDVEPTLYQEVLEARLAHTEHAVNKMYDTFCSMIEAARKTIINEVKENGIKGYLLKGFKGKKLDFPGYAMLENKCSKYVGSPVNVSHIDCMNPSNGEFAYREYTFFLGFP
jgi:hypothetical protein